MGALREIAAILGIEVEGEKNVEGAEKKVGSLIEKLKQVGEVVAEAFAWEKVKEFVEGQVEAATELERTSQMLGLTTQALETYRFAAADSGIASEAMSVGLHHLNLAISLAGSGSAQHAKVFAELGIKLKDSAGHARAMSDVMADVADKIAATEDPTKKTQIAVELLGRHGAALIPLLNRGSKAFEEASASMEELGGTTSPQFIESAKKIEEQQNRLNLVMGNFKQTVAFALFPAFEKLIEYAIRWTKAALDFAKQTTLLKTGLEALAVVATFKTAASLFALGQKLGFVKGSVLETVAAMARFAIPLAIIAALYLLFDDFFNLFTGGQSLIGEVLDDLFGMGAAEQVAMDLTDAFGTLLDVLKDVAKVIGNQILLAIDDVSDSLKLVWNVIGDIMTGQFGQLGKDVSAFVAESNAHGKKREDATMAAAADIPAAFGRTYHTQAQADRAHYKSAYAAGIEQMGPAFAGPVYVPMPGAAGAPGAPGAPGSGGVVVHQTVHNTTHVHTSDNPKAVGEAASTGAATGVQKANNNAWNSAAVRKF